MPAGDAVQTEIKTNANNTTLETNITTSAETEQDTNAAQTPVFPEQSTNNTDIGDPLTYDEIDNTATEYDEIEAPPINNTIIGYIVDETTCEPESAYMNPNCSSTETATEMFNMKKSAVTANADNITEQITTENSDENDETDLTEITTFMTTIDDSFDYNDELKNEKLELEDAQNYNNTSATINITSSTISPDTNKNNSTHTPNNAGYNESTSPSTLLLNAAPQLLVEITTEVNPTTKESQQLNSSYDQTDEDVNAETEAENDQNEIEIEPEVNKENELLPATQELDSNKNEVEVQDKIVESDVKPSSHDIGNTSNTDMPLLPLNQMLDLQNHQDLTNETEIKILDPLPESQTNISVTLTQNATNLTTADIIPESTINKNNTDMLVNSSNQLEENTGTGIEPEVNNENVINVENIELITNDTRQTIERANFDNLALSAPVDTTSTESQIYVENINNTNIENLHNITNHSKEIAEVTDIPVKPEPNISTSAAPEITVENDHITNTTELINNTEGKNEENAKVSQEITTTPEINNVEIKTEINEEMTSLESIGNTGTVNTSPVTDIPVTQTPSTAISATPEVTDVTANITDTDNTELLNNISRQLQENAKFLQNISSTPKPNNLVNHIELSNRTTPETITENDVIQNKNNGEILNNGSKQLEEHAQTNVPDTLVSITTSKEIIDKIVNMTNTNNAELLNNITEQLEKNAILLHNISSTSTSDNMEAQVTEPSLLLEKLKTTPKIIELRKHSNNKTIANVDVTKVQITEFNESLIKHDSANETTSQKSPVDVEFNSSEHKPEILYAKHRSNFETNYPKNNDSFNKKVGDVSNPVKDTGHVLKEVHKPEESEDETINNESPNTEVDKTNHANAEISNLKQDIPELVQPELTISELSNSDTTKAELVSSENLSAGRTNVAGPHVRPGHMNTEQADTEMYNTEPKSKQHAGDVVAHTTQAMQPQRLDVAPVQPQPPATHDYLSRNVNNQHENIHPAARNEINPKVTAMNVDTLHSKVNFATQNVTTNLNHTLPAPQRAHSFKKQLNATNVFSYVNRNSTKAIKREENYNKEEYRMKMNNGNYNPAIQNQPIMLNNLNQNYVNNFKPVPKTIQTQPNNFNQNSNIYLQNFKTVPSAIQTQSNNFQQNSRTYLHNFKPIPAAIQTQPNNFQQNSRNYLQNFNSVHTPKTFIDVYNMRQVNTTQQILPRINKPPSLPAFIIKHAAALSPNLSAIQKPVMKYFVQRLNITEIKPTQQSVQPEIIAEERTSSDSLEDELDEMTRNEENSETSKDVTTMLHSFPPNSKSYPGTQPEGCYTGDTTTPTSIEPSTAEEILDINTKSSIVTIESAISSENIIETVTELPKPTKPATINPFANMNNNLQYRLRGMQNRNNQNNRNPPENDVETVNEASEILHQDPYLQKLKVKIKNNHNTETISNIEYSPLINKIRESKIKFEPKENNIILKKTDTKEYKDYVQMNKENLIRSRVGKIGTQHWNTDNIQHISKENIGLNTYSNDNIWSRASKLPQQYKKVHKFNVPLENVENIINRNLRNNPSISTTIISTETEEKSVDSQSVDPRKNNHDPRGLTDLLSSVKQNETTNNVNTNVPTSVLDISHKPGASTEKLRNQWIINGNDQMAHKNMPANNNKIPEGTGAPAPKEGIQRLVFRFPVPVNGVFKLNCPKNSITITNGYAEFEIYIRKYANRNLNNPIIQSPRKFSNNKVPVRL